MKALGVAACVALAGCESVGLGGGGSSCVVTYDVKGTVHLDLEESVASGDSPGSTEVDWTMKIQGRQGNGCGNEGNPGDFDHGGDLTGTLDGFHFSSERKATGSFVTTSRVEVGGQKVGEGATGFVQLSRTGAGVTGGDTSTDLQSAASWNLTWK
jgi:hypothetical protein